MEQKLEKICKVRDLKKGFRYNMSHSGHHHFCFVVELVGDSGDIYVRYLDGIVGCFRNPDMVVFEHPYSSLEKELL
jgi:hypothetical protein